MREPEEALEPFQAVSNGHGLGRHVPATRVHHLRIRLSDEVYDLLKARAREQHRSMQGQVLRLIETDVRRAKKETP